MKTLLAWLKDKDKKNHVYLGMLLVIGVLLMLFSRWPAQRQPASPAPAAQALTQPPEVPANHASAERELERRLEEAFSLVENVGRVRVMLRFTPGKETVYASDAATSESYTRETDGQGGSRETRNIQNQGKTITITDRAGEQRPLVLRETEPRIAGVIIIAEGGDSVFVKDALTKAACTVLGIEANRVQVMKMALETNRVEGR
jgi:stage III sporulation protein AG